MIGIGDIDHLDWQALSDWADEFTLEDEREYQLWLEEKYRGVDPQQQDQDELLDYLVEQEEEEF